jgi:Flp pilus assembly pilin Flp
MLNNFWNDEAGFIVSAELVLVATILVIGLIVGLIELQASIIHELNDLGEAIGSLNQSYSFAGTVTTKGPHLISTAGSAYVDTSDVACCDCNEGVSLYCTNPTIKEPLAGGS